MLTYAHVCSRMLTYAHAARWLQELLKRLKALMEASDHAIRFRAIFFKKIKRKKNRTKKMQVPKIQRPHATHTSA